MSIANGNGHHDRPRDLAFERAFTISAASGTGVNPTPPSRRGPAQPCAVDATRRPAIW
jgi:hypothetical protein